MSARRYLVTARKYRPQRFFELVAQEHVTRTLKNALRMDRLAHAYLFSGPRGVGKTTAARILAKAINCTLPLEEREARAEPCRRCESCETFEQGRSLNVIEIDAASNNRVDDIRDLRETVRIPPQGALRKVYIVDEVHMLSAAAFNALLKTLEEPPPHVLFIFATTEPHKVLPTILSRCQRFDFRRVAVEEIVSLLQSICEQEQIQADEASLLLIARKGDGALRDALSVFDQAVSLCGSRITYANLVQALGVVDVDRYFEVTEHVLNRDTAGMLLLVDKVIRAGHDIQEFLAGLAEHLRNLLVARSMKNIELIEAAEPTRQRYAGIAQHFSELDLLRLLTLAADAEEAVKNSVQPRLKIETILLKMALITLGADLRKVIAQIDRLKGPVGAFEEPAGKKARPPNSRDEPAGSSSPASGDPGRAGASQSPKPAHRSTPDPTPESPPPPDRPKPIGHRTPLQEATPEPPHGKSATGVLGKPALEAAPARAREETREQSGSPLGKPAPEAVPTQVKDTLLVEDIPSNAKETQEPNAEVITAVWQDLLSRAKEEHTRVVWSSLCGARPERYEDEVVHVAVPDDHHRQVLEDEIPWLTKHLESMTNLPIRTIRFLVRKHVASPGTHETGPDADPYEAIRQLQRKYPIVREIFKQFDGEPAW